MAVTGKKPHSRDLVSAVLLLKLSASEKLVLQALCWHYPNPIPSVARIAAMSSQTERWVRQCLRSLQKKGLIEVHYRRDGQAQGTNFYMVKPDRILMQAGKRGKTTLRGGGSEFRGGGNSVPGEGEEVSTPKQSALDKAKKQDKKQNKKQQNVIENKASKPTRQQEEEDYELPSEEFGKESSTELSWENVREMEELHNNDTDSNINPCLQSSSSIHTTENLSTESPMIPNERSCVPRTESPSTKPAYRLIISHLSGKVFRQYPDGHCEEASEREQSARQAAQAHE